MSTILVVEDDPLIRETLSLSLEIGGYQVVEATNGQEALDALGVSKDPPCMILLDLMMPVMDGVEFRRRQLQDSRIAGVPVAVMTGRADAATIENIRSLRVFQKPFHLDDVMAMIETCCPI